MFLSDIGSPLSVDTLMFLSDIGVMSSRFAVDTVVMSARTASAEADGALAALLNATLIVLVSKL